MKRRLISIVLALAMVLAMSSAVFAANQYAGMYSGIAGNEKMILVSDSYNKIIWKYENGNLSRFAGAIGPKGIGGEPEGAYVDASLATARFMEPWAIAPFGEGWAVSDPEAHVIRYIDSAAVRTLAGSGQSSSINGSGKGAAFMRPTGLAADDKGNLYIADSDAGTIRKMDSKGNVSTVYSGLAEPTGIYWKGDALYIAETGNNRILKLSGGALTILAGGSEGYSDGKASSAKFSNPLGIAVDDKGTVYVADTGNSSLRKIEGGMVSTVIADGDAGVNIVAPRSIYIMDKYLVVTDNYTGQLIVREIEDASFNDIPSGAWYEAAVNSAKDRRIILGTGDNQFAPYDAFTRAQLVTILSRLEQMDDRNLIINGESNFTDVAASAYYAKAVGWAYENKMVDGYPDGTFAPNSSISRQDIATMLYRYALKKSIAFEGSAAGDMSKFKDVDNVSSYAKSAVSWAVGTGIMNGSDGYLLPQYAATRAEAIQLVMNFINHYNL